MFDEKGNIPVLTVSGSCLAETWENSLISLNDFGCRVKTQYDKQSDPPSIDATMIMVVENPLAEPMIHKDFPGGPEDLQEYVMEVVDGIKDHCIRNPNDPNDTRWEYTYHQRLFKYDVMLKEKITLSPVVNRDPKEGYFGPEQRDDFVGWNRPKIFDQIELVCQNLAKTPFTRRAQAITWKVWEDNDCYDPACLQSIWCRILEDEKGGWVLNTNVRFRSNDAYKAAFMNMFAITKLQEKIAKRISELSGKQVKLGRYVHEADSYHIYGSYFNEFEERFLKSLDRRSFEERTLRYEDVKDIMDEAVPGILKKASEMRH